jgi:hypothetical protein
VVQVVACLPRKCEAPSLNPSATKKKVKAESTHIQVFSYLKILLYMKS